MDGVNLEESQQKESQDWVSSVRSVTDGAALYFGSKMTKNGVTFLLSLLLTNFLGANLYGVYTLSRQIVSELHTFTNLGTEVAITRLLSDTSDDPAYKDKVFFMSYTTSMIVSTIGAAILFLTAPVINTYTLEDPLFIQSLQVFAIAIPFISLTKLGTNSFRGLEMPVHQNLLKIGVQLLRLAVIGGAVVGGYALLGAAIGFAIANVLALGLVTIVLLVRTDLRPSWNLSKNEIKHFYNYSLPLSGSKAGSLLYNRVDVFMVGIFLSSVDVGIYSISMLLGGIILLPLSGFNQFFPPVASRLYSEGDIETLQSVFTTVTRWAITATLFFASVMILYRTELLMMFGEEFTAGTVVLALFVIGKAIVAFSGPSNDLLMMTDHQYAVMINHWSFGILNVILNYFLIMELGLIGAAVATASVLAFLNIVRVIEVWYFEGMLPYSRRLWKPITAALVAMGVMYGASLALSGLPLLVVGSAIGGIVYFSVLYLLGIEQRDKQMVEDYYSVLS